ncbi:sarcoplasmic/endoplasmic reticulum calcium ATPase regulator DWORF [Agelaius tricolor]|uniref:sarcoplasmic/endoplasmic reticulum calcium ATPase regulator DWORF n=1 Tax=Agelaius tricolor TaxID=9191 RepID=UPI0039F205E5
MALHLEVPSPVLAVVGPAQRVPASVTDPVLFVLCPVSCVLSHVLCPVSCALCPVSCSVSHILCPVSHPAQAPLSRLLVPVLLALGWILGCALMVYIVFS